MKCDSWPSLLARTFANPYFGCKPNARIVTLFKMGSHDPFEHLKHKLWPKKEP